MGFARGILWDVFMTERHFVINGSLHVVFCNTNAMKKWDAFHPSFVAGKMGYGSILKVLRWRIAGRKMKYC